MVQGSSSWVGKSQQPMLRLRSRLPSFLLLGSGFPRRREELLQHPFFLPFLPPPGKWLSSLSLSGRFSRPPKSINKDRVWKEGRARGPGSRADRGSRYQNNEEGMRILGETGSYLIQFWGNVSSYLSNSWQRFSFNRMEREGEEAVDVFNKIDLERGKNPLWPTLWWKWRRREEGEATDRLSSPQSGSPFQIWILQSVSPTAK